MDDLISRQAAIDALKQYRRIFCDNTPDTFTGLPYGEKCRVDEIDNAIATLINLPSAQPEIIRCKNCKHRHLKDDVWTCPFGLPGGEDFFCGYGAERREDV